jgi:hypothetical protein
LNHISESNGQLLFTERMSPGLRVFIFLVGFVPFLAPYELLFRPRWNGVGVVLIIAIIISLGASAVGIAFILAGIFGLNQTLCFDIVSKSVLYTFETSITPVRKKRYDFNDITKIEIKTMDWESKPPTYGLRFIFADNRKVEMGEFARQDEAQDYVRRIQNLLQ